MDPMARVSELLAAGRTFSFEFFPPKTDGAQLSLGRAIAELEPLGPSFVSVTYGAGGSTRRRTREVVTWVRRETEITPMAHLTCQSHTRDEIQTILDDYRTAGIDNILALGGDPPSDPADVRPSDYQFATDLIDDIEPLGHFSIGVAAHPELHPRSPDRETDRRLLAAKLRRADFAITQFFFEAQPLPASRRRARRAGCHQAGHPRDHADHQRRSGGADGRAQRRGGADVVDRPARRRRGSDGGASDRGRRRHRPCVPNCSPAGAPGLHFYTLNRSTATREIYANLGLAVT